MLLKIDCDGKKLVREFWLYGKTFPTGRNVVGDCVSFEGGSVRGLKNQFSKVSCDVARSVRLACPTHRHSYRIRFILVVSPSIQGTA